MENDPTDKRTQEFRRDVEAIEQANRIRELEAALAKVTAERDEAGKRDARRCDCSPSGHVLHCPMRRA
jgi:hypothetical protein